MLAIRLPTIIEKRLDKLAARTGRTKTYYAREAILRLKTSRICTLPSTGLKSQPNSGRLTSWSRTLIWTIKFDDRARKELRKLDQTTQHSILKYLRERIATKDDPRRFGKQLSADMSGLWRYRIGDYRVICTIQDECLFVLVLRVGHRGKVYTKGIVR
jgi:mRNA interferase RelE/StbE